MSNGVITPGDRSCVAPRLSEVCLAAPFLAVAKTATSIDVPASANVTGWMFQDLTESFASTTGWTNVGRAS